MGLLIVIAVPSDLLRKGLPAVFENDPSVSNVIEVTCRAEFFTALETYRPDRIIIHQSLIEDITVLPEGRCILITSEPDIQMLRTALVHARGYLLESTTADWLLMASLLGSGNCLIDPALAPWLHEVLSKRNASPVDAYHEPLTPREFADPNSSQCASLPQGACWVESGISTWPANESNNCNQGHDSTCLFWADSRPNPGGYHEHPLYNFGADGVDLTPYLVYISILNNDSFSSSGSNWDVETNIYKNGNYLAGPSGESKSNSMNVDDITIGSELSDSKGSAGTFYFQDNQWMDGSGNWKYQTTTARNSGTNPPPHGFWEVYPCSCQGNTGGSYGTYD